MKAVADSLQGNESKPEPKSADDHWADYCWLDDSCSSAPAIASAGDESASGTSMMMMSMMMMCYLRTLSLSSVVLFP